MIWAKVILCLGERFSPSSTALQTSIQGDIIRTCALQEGLAPTLAAQSNVRRQHAAHSTVQGAVWLEIPWHRSSI